MNGESKQAYLERMRMLLREWSTHLDPQAVDLISEADEVPIDFRIPIEDLQKHSTYNEEKKETLSLNHTFQVLKRNTESFWHGLTHLVNRTEGRNEIRK